MLRKATLLVVLLAASGARADDAVRAKTLYDAGLVYYQEGNFQRALESFDAAYATAPRAELLYNIAQCHDRLGRADETITYLVRYLDAAPNAPDRTTVEAWMRSLESRVKQSSQPVDPPPAVAPAPSPAPPPPATPPAAALAPRPEPAASAAPPVAAKESPPPAPATPWHRRGWVWAAASVVVVAAVATLIVVTHQGDGQAADDDPLIDFGGQP